MPACTDSGFCAKGLLCQDPGAAELPEVALIQRIIFRTVATPMVRKASPCQAATAAGTAPVMGVPQRHSGSGHTRAVSAVDDYAAGLHGTDESEHTQADAVQVRYSQDNNLWQSSWPGSLILSVPLLGFYLITNARCTVAHMASHLWDGY